MTAPVKQPGGARTATAIERGCDSNRSGWARALFASVLLHAAGGLLALQLLRASASLVMIPTAIRPAPAEATLLAFRPETTVVPVDVKLVSAGPEGRSGTLALGLKNASPPAARPHLRPRSVRARASEPTSVLELAPLPEAPLAPEPPEPSTDDAVLVAAPPASIESSAVPEPPSPPGLPRGALDADGRGGDGDGSGSGDRGDGRGAHLDRMGSELHARVVGDDAARRDAMPPDEAPDGSPPLPSPVPFIGHKEATDLRVRDLFPRLGEEAWAGRGPYVVELDVCVTATGHVGEATLRSSASARLDPIVLRAVRGWRYRPRTVDGKPGPFCHHVVIKYERW
jgi:hypothetical protein